MRRWLVLVLVLVLVYVCGVRPPQLGVLCGVSVDAHVCPVHISNLCVLLYTIYGEYLPSVVFSVMRRWLMYDVFVRHPQLGDHCVYQFRCVPF